jgi:hypothetical protein
MLELAPDALDVDHHGVEAAPLAATFEALWHHQPQDDVNEESEALEEYQKEKCDAHP